MARRDVKAWLLVSVCGLLLSIHGAAAQAAVTQPPSGISITPFLQQISLPASTPSEQFTLTIANHTASLQEIDLSVRDFGSLNDTGGILLEGSDSKYSQKYGLVSWLTLGTDTVVLRAGESAAVPVTIDNRSDLQPGGHYGAVVASVNSLDSQAGNHVVINQQLLSLLLVDKIGGEHYDLKLTGLDQNGNAFHLPSTVTLHFQNPGNVHVVPRGLVQLKSPTGKVVATGIINQDSGFILPQSYRDIYVQMTKIGDSLPLPGLYSLVVSYRYDGITNVAVHTQHLQFVDAGLYVLGIVVAFGVIRIVRHKRKKAPQTTTEIIVEKIAEEPVPPAAEKVSKKVPQKAIKKVTKKPAKKSKKTSTKKSK